ncbi:MAG: SPOR domain-containing protein, partial [Aquabacterium sp.]|nr:SPOR domain-containing protein [Aquabacterium sp.]
ALARAASRAGAAASAAGTVPAAAAPVAAFFVQAGAYARPDDADAQRAKLAMLGLSAKITEREQAGRTVYRVRLGPFDTREPAEDAQAKLAGAGIEANLVRVER